MYARIMYAKATEDADAAEDGQDTRTCPAFKCKMYLLGPIGSATPSSGTMDEITNPEFYVFNGTTSAIAKDDIIQIGQTVVGRWMVIEGGGGGGGKIFKTPSGGIAKRNLFDNQCSFATCVEYIINEDDILASADRTEKVYNIWACDIFGDTFITAKSVSGKWVVDAEDYINPSQL